MKATEVRRMMGRAYAAHEPISVVINGAPMRLRTCLSVGDAEVLLDDLERFIHSQSLIGAAKRAVEGGDESFQALLDEAERETKSVGPLCLKLFEVLAEDEDGNPIVDPNERDWYDKSAPAGEIISVVSGCGLIAKVLANLAPKEDEEAGEPEGKPKP